MRLRLWLATAFALGTLLASPALAADEPAPADGQPAAPLPQACVDAGVATEADCAALLADKKAAKKAAADKAAADEAAHQAAAAEQAAAAQAAADKAAADKAAAAQAAANEAAMEQAAAEKAAAKKAAADQAAADKAAAAQAAADDAAAQQAAAEKAAAKKAAVDQAAADQAAADKAAADQAAADETAAAKAAAMKAEADKRAAEKAAAAATPPADAPAVKPAKKGPRVKLAQDCLDAGLTTAQDCDALHAVAAQTAKAKAADQAAADAAATEKAAADKAAAAAAEAPPPADAPAAKPAKKTPRVKLAQDCLDAGITAPEDCDALHAIAGQTAKAKPAPETPAAPPAAAAVEPVPVTPAGPLPAEVTPAKATPDAPAEPAPPPAAPALPDIAKGLNAAAKAHNRAVAALSKVDADPAAAEKARAKIAAVGAEIDALCKSNAFESTAQCLAQFGIELAPVPPAGGGQQAALAPAPKVQPVEVIDKLPKGVKKEDVAPLFDSAKDQETGKGPAAPPAAAKPLNAVEAAALAAPPPKTDKAAQAGFTPAKLAPIDQQKGQTLDANAVGQVQVPQNVTIVTQNIVNNTTTNTTTNNTTNNTQINNAPAAPGEQPGKPGKVRRGSEAPDNPIGLGIGIVLQFGNQTIINSPAEDHRRIAYNPEDRTTYERLPEGRFRETVRRADGVRIVTIYNRNGDILRRSRIGRDGREIVLAYFDDAHDRELLEWHDPGEDLPPLRLRIPAREYVLDADGADQVHVQQFFAQPPVERVRRLYSIAEVKRSARIRDTVRRLEIGNLTFNTGAATVSQDQVGNLAKVAGAMLRLLDRNPGETFLIEGHTDAVGGEIANLQLSDARAATIARILTDFYDVPPENLATQGYGERYLKVQTELAERLNRRVTVRRITSLVTLSRN